MPGDLQQVALSDVLPPRPGDLLMTLSAGEWDEALAAAYEAGWVLLELDAKGQPVRAYQRRDRG